MLKPLKTKAMKKLSLILMLSTLLVVAIIAASAIFAFYSTIYDMYRDDCVKEYRHVNLKLGDEKMPELEISDELSKKISNFRKPLQEVAYYMLSNTNEFKLDRYKFTCGIFSFWVANDWKWFELDSPVEMKLNPDEKDFFWKMFIKFRDEDQRLYRYENEITVTTK